MKDVYYLKGWHKSMLVSAYTTKVDLINVGYVIIPYNGMELVTLPTEEPFFAVYNKWFYDIPRQHIRLGRKFKVLHGCLEKYGEYTFYARRCG